LLDAVAWEPNQKFIFRPNAVDEHIKQSFVTSNTFKKPTLLPCSLPGLNLIPGLVSMTRIDKYGSRIMLCPTLEFFDQKIGSFPTVFSNIILMLLREFGDTGGSKLVAGALF
jgi:hypothetical protein